MSQNDFTIANQSFPAFRADLNSALQALASNNSGASVPSTTFANMWWYDSANNIMYIRNEDNDAWIKFAELDQANDKFVLSGTLQLDDGTVSAPALTFNSDTNMGIYRGGTDILKFVTAGVDVITINASQNVGIGTTSPSQRLDVKGASAFTSDADAYTGGVGIASKIVTGGGSNDIGIQSQDIIQFATGGTTERMRIDSNGNVGIGITSLSAVKMEVLATTSDNLVARFENNHATGSYGIAVKAGDDSGNYTADFANKSGTSLMRIRGDGNVGIGTSTPASLFGTGTTVEINGSGGAALRLARPSYANGDLYADENGLTIRTQNNYQMRFLTNNTLAATIDTSQNLLVGTTNPVVATTTTTGVALSNDGYVAASRSASASGYFNRLSDGTIIDIRKDGSTVGSIGVLTGDLILGTGDIGLYFADSLDSILPANTTTNAVSNGVCDLGRGVNRFKDLYLSGGVYLGGTGSANHLDDYEEGTWTATLSQGTCTTAHASYTKIGKRVHVSATLTTFSDRSSPSSVEIQGLPFARDTSKDEVAGGPAMWSFVDEANTVAYVATAGLQFYTSQSAGFTSLRYADLNSASAQVYFVATFYST